MSFLMRQCIVNLKNVNRCRTVCVLLQTVSILTRHNSFRCLFCSERGKETGFRYNRPFNDGQVN